MSVGIGTFATLHLTRMLSNMECVGEVADACSRMSDDELLLARVEMGELQLSAMEVRVEAETRENKLLVFCAAMDDALRQRGILEGDDDPGDD